MEFLFGLGIGIIFGMYRDKIVDLGKKIIEKIKNKKQENEK